MHESTSGEGVFTVVVVGSPEEGGWRVQVRVRVRVRVRTQCARTIEHDRRALCRLAHIASLLFQLAHGGLLCCLTFIDEAGRDLYTDLVYRWTVLLLENDLRPCRMGAGKPGLISREARVKPGSPESKVRTGRLLKDSHDANAIDVAPLGACRPLAGLPVSNLSCRIVVCDSCKEIAVSALTGLGPSDERYTTYLTILVHLASLSGCLAQGA